MKPFGIKFKDLFLSEEAKLIKPTVGEIWNVFKSCTLSLEVDKRNDIGKYSFYGCLAKYEEEPLFELTFNYNNFDCYFGCFFSADGHPLLEEINSAEVYFEEMNGTLIHNFIDMEQWDIFVEFRDLQLEYTIEYELEEVTKKCT